MRADGPAEAMAIIVKLCNILVVEALRLGSRPQLLWTLGSALNRRGEELATVIGAKPNKDVVVP